MNEQNNESQPTPKQTQPAQTNQNKPALAGACHVCGAGCRAGDALCLECDWILRGWLCSYPEWLESLHEFLDSTVHYGGHQPGRVNLPSAPTPIRLSVVDHLQEVDDLAVMLWRRLYAPPAMPWVTRAARPRLLGMLRDCAACPRLSRLPDIDSIYRDWERMARRTLDIIRRADRETWHRQMSEPAVWRRIDSGGRRGKRCMSRVRQHLPCGGCAVGVPAGMRSVGTRVHGGGVRGTVARMRIPVQREHDSLMAQARQAPTGW